jgi:NADPH-dependent curcumin reductase CurA
MPTASKRVHLLRRPDGKASPDDFAVVDAEIAEPGPGEVLVRNIWMSIDPYMRRNMDADAKDLQPWPIGEALNGPCVGRVIASQNARFKEGDLVESMSGWQEHFLSDGSAFVPYLSADNSIAVRGEGKAKPRDYVGLLGMASMTAYAAMIDLAQIQPGETVVVSSGAGAVGSLACQMAKIKGARVVSSAGSAAKVKWLHDVAGVDVAFNYRERDIQSSLAEACPDGIDLVLENASPEHLSACFPLMNELKRILIAGFVSIYDSGGTIPALRNFEYVLDRFITVRAFRFMDSLHLYDQFVADMVGWRADGKIVLPETVHTGLASAPSALCDMLSGKTFGKQIVRLSIDPAD